MGRPIDRYLDMIHRVVVSGIVVFCTFGFAGNVWYMSQSPKRVAARKEAYRLEQEEKEREASLTEAVQEELGKTEAVANSLS